MTRIKIEDLPQDMKITKEEMKRVMGGIEVGEVKWFNSEYINPVPGSDELRLNFTKLEYRG